MAHYKKGKNFACDEYETPPSTLDMILEELNQDEVYVWEPFRGSGNSTNYMRSKGFKVTNGDFPEDFFKHATLPTIPEDEILIYDPEGKVIGQRKLVVVTNPPYSIKREVIQKFKELGIISLALLIPVGTIFAKYWTQTFPQDSNQMITHIGRCKFLHPISHEPIKGSASFDVCWISNNMNLSKDLQYK